MVTLFLGHLLIDFLGNGVNLLYPFTNEEQNFAILGSNNELIISVLLTIATTVTLISRKISSLAIISVVLAVSFVFTLGISNAVINYSLQKGTHPIIRNILSCTQTKLHFTGTIT